MKKRKYIGNYIFTNMKVYPIYGQIYNTTIRESFDGSRYIYVYNENGSCISCFDYKKEDWEER